MDKSRKVWEELPQKKIRRVSFTFRNLAPGPRPGNTVSMGDGARKWAQRREMALVLLWAIACQPVAAAPPPAAPAPPPAEPAWVATDTCYEALDALHVRWRPAKPRPGIALPVEVLGPLGGVTYVPWGKKKNLVLDCSLIEALARSGPFLTAQGIVLATYSGGYNVRNIRGTNKPSSHGFGLALDVHRYGTASGVWLSVDEHFETALGDEVDCIGAPRTPEARVLKTVHCQMIRSGLFRFVLGPDDDADHRNHFHVEAEPWERRSQRSAR